MLTRPPTLSESEDRGRGLVEVTPDPAVPLADEADDVIKTPTGGFGPPPASPLTVSPIHSLSPCPPPHPPPTPPPPPRCTSSAPSLIRLTSFLFSPDSFVPPLFTPSPPPRCTSSRSPSLLRHSSSALSSLNPNPPCISSAPSVAPLSSFLSPSFRASPPLRVSPFCNPSPPRTSLSPCPTSNSSPSDPPPSPSSFSSPPPPLPSPSSVTSSPPPSSITYSSPPPPLSSVTYPPPPSSSTSPPPPPSSVTSPPPFHIPSAPSSFHPSPTCTSSSPSLTSTPSFLSCPPFSTPSPPPPLPPSSFLATPLSYSSSQRSTAPPAVFLKCLIPPPPSSPPSESITSFAPGYPLTSSAPLFSLSSSSPPPPLSSSSAPPPPLSFSSSPPVSSAPASPFSPLSVSSSVPPSLHFSPPSLSSDSVHTTPLSPSPPAPPPPHPCCPCSVLLPRLLSAHRLEVRRLLQGALASLGRRLDSLERRRGRKRRRRRRHRGEEEAGSSPDSEDPPIPNTSSGLNRSEQKRSRGGEDHSGRGRKRRRNNGGGRERQIFPGDKEEEEEEEKDTGRFVGRMAVSFKRVGGGGELPLTLHNFNHRKRKRDDSRASHSEMALSMVRRNGYRVLHRSSSPSSQHALHLLQPAKSGYTSSQSEALNISSGQWCFSDLSSPLSPSANHSVLHLCLSSSPSFSLTPLLRLSVVAVETMSDRVRGGVCVRPLRSLEDWTAPPSLTVDHSYVRTSSPSPVFPARRLQRQRANHSTRSIHLPRRRALPLPPSSAPLPISQSATDCEFLNTNGERGKRVSQIRIRRASPREMPLTPMGLPKVKRLKKKEFSLEEIYTNKNYKSPTTNRSLETIFEEPRDKDGAPFVIGQQKRRRLLLFPDFTQPRKRKKPAGVGLPVATMPRKRAAARRHCHGSPADESDLDVMLVERLSALEDFLARQGLDV
ncbi:nascent polypeptide-associated complex subunit alpha%2C muscle-specific form [Xyrichtys novacula]|uniref:Nascent polypeptide-associated complex subunit alpha, muscle-specific form n=1 Tax=Xyrichtys novacula TaxID=13765 RepID=A0AAV1GC83_XYRNO|nr:nascent polypeptide-associated complex subunit alpha%2C muscle-specific form [Xyrichtys novacula]